MNDVDVLLDPWHGVVCSGHVGVNSEPDTVWNIVAVLDVGVVNVPLDLNIGTNQGRPPCGFSVHLSSTCGTIYPGGFESIFFVVPSSIWAGVKQVTMLRTTMFLTAATATMGLELTPDTWDVETSGKTVFLKFFAPWCGHCKAMKPAWDSLMAEYEDSPTVLVADVDCIGSGKDLCSKFGVQGFPTVKYGDPVNLEDYKGGRDLATLQTFTSELKPACNVGTLENCSDAEKATIVTLESQTIAELKATIGEESTEREAVDSLFTSNVQKLQTDYQGLVAQKASSLAEIGSKYNVGLVQAVLAKKEGTKDEL